MFRRVVVAALVAPAVIFIACGEPLPLEQPTDGGADGTTEAASDGGTEAGCSAAACAEVVGTLGAPGTRVVVVGDTTYVIRGTGDAARLVRLRGPLPAQPEVIRDEQVFGNIIPDSYGGGVYWGAVGGLRFVAHDAGPDGASIVRSEPNVTGLALESATKLRFATFGPRKAAPSDDGGSTRTCLTSGLYPHECTGDGEEYTSYPSDIIYPKGSPAPEVVMAWPDDDAGGPAVMVSKQAVSAAGALTAPRWFASDDNAVYVAAAEGLFRVTVSPSPPKLDSLLATTAATRVNAVTTTENARLVLAHGSSIETCTVVASSCQPVVVVTLVDDTINDVAVTTEHFYFVTQNGGVYRLKRP